MFLLIQIIAFRFRANKPEELNYQQTLKYLFEQLPMFQRVGAAAYRADLHNITRLCEITRQPQKDLKCIHVAGTNGKGSVTHLLASILQEQGYKVGIFVSPHYKDYRERIKINGQFISKKFVAAFISEHFESFKNVNASFFEMTTVLAFAYFKKEQVDVAVIETGMGGRLDSTNIITPILSVITNISLDHQQFLGDTPAKIAVEKAGIIKTHIPVVIGESTTETKPVFLNRSKQMQSPVYFAGRPPESYSSLLPGPYQKKNIATVLKAVEVLKKTGFKISESSVKKGIKNVVSNTAFIGRWMLIQKNPLVIFDSAHNEAGLNEVVKELRRLMKQRLPEANQRRKPQIHFVYGTVNDKDLSACLSLLPPKAVYYFCKADIPRGKDAGELMREAAEFQLKGRAYSSVKTAYQAAMKAAGKNDVVIVAGSIFVVAELV